MPELPEVETMRRGLLGTQGHKIRDIIKPVSKYRPIGISPVWSKFRTESIGQEIVAVRRIAKRVLVDLSGGKAIVFQPKMAGLLVTENPPSDAHIRFRFALENPNASMPTVDEFIYWDRRGLGTVHLWDRDQQQQLGPPKLGPDALAVTADNFHEIFRSNQREIKVALLDQKMVAGVGNLYASEILHRSSVHPQTRCHRLSKKRWLSVWGAMQEILNDAIEYEGSTLSDGTYRNAVSDPGRYQNEHLVYARQGEVCKSCGEGQIIRIVQAQRSTFFCPKCQRR